jgi:hypothetical protein
VVGSVWILRSGEELPGWSRTCPRDAMKYELLQSVVLDRDLPGHGLKQGDLGSVVEIYEPDRLEVEFVGGSGRTEALVTLQVTDVRALSDRDLIAVRPLERPA